MSSPTNTLNNQVFLFMAHPTIGCFYMILHMQGLDLKKKSDQPQTVVVSVKWWWIRRVAIRKQSHQFKQIQDEVANTVSTRERNILFLKLDHLPNYGDQNQKKHWNHHLDDPVIPTTPQWDHGASHQRMLPSVTLLQLGWWSAYKAGNCWSYRTQITLSFSNKRFKDCFQPE